jgi:MFS family permease
MTERHGRYPLLVLVCAVLIALLGFGCRQTFGMFLRPVSEAIGLGEDVRVMSFATGLQALMYGVAAPIVGAIADRFGPIRVIVVSALIYAGGLLGMAHSESPAELVLYIGILTGIGSAGVAMPLLLSIVSRVASERRRTFWLACVVSGSTAGQLLIVPLSHHLIATTGWSAAAIVLGLLISIILPLAVGVAFAAGPAISAGGHQSLRDALREARSHRGFWLLTTGFFVCGFQVQFINNHLENYLNATVVGGAMAATAIALIGFFNMIGTQIAGAMGGRFQKKRLLAYLYVGRSLLFLAFFLVPVSQLSVIVFACAVGLLWLATVPLTSGIVAQVFGTRYMATLYGLVFLSHQIGSFTSVYVAGIIRTETGSYDVAWWMIIAAGFVAAVLHWPIDDRPLPRVAAQASAATA